MTEKIVGPGKNRMIRRVLRLAGIALCAFLIFRFVFRPMFISGASMLPAYPERGFIFCFAPAFAFSRPERGDVCVFSFAGERIMLLKRILAFENETVEFRDGVLYVNGRVQAEPYVKLRGEPWNMAPVTVAQGKVFVLGDNRSMSREAHKGGEIDLKRLRGKPLW